MKFNQKNFIGSSKYLVLVYFAILALLPVHLSATPADAEEVAQTSSKLTPEELENLLHLNELNLVDVNNNNPDESSIQQQRASLKPFTQYLFALYLQEQLKNHQDNGLLRSYYGSDDAENGMSNEDEEESDEGGAALQKRSRVNLMSKKDDQKLRRQQAARWDIGFGKRASGSLKSKSFMDALYGKRSSLKHVNPKMTFGRKQQWDIQYGRK